MRCSAIIRLASLLSFWTLSCAPPKAAAPRAPVSNVAASGAAGSGGAQSDGAKEPDAEKKPAHVCPCRNKVVPPGSLDGQGEGSDKAPGETASENPGELSREEAPSPPPVNLRESELLLERALGYDALVDVPVELKFRGGTMSFYAGCNTNSGAFSVRDGVLSISGFRSTLGGCEPSRNHDRWLHGFFSGRPTVTLSGSRLTMKSGPVTLVFLDVEVADPDRALVGTPWDVVEFLNEHSRFSADLGERPEVEFLADGTVRVSTGCNTGRGTFTLDERAITFGPIAYTKVACVDELARDAEAAVKAVLAAGQVSFEIGRARLSLRRGSLGIIARAE